MRWTKAIARRHGEALLWRLLRIGNAPYFVLGTGPGGEPVRLRVAGPWDWRRHYEFLALDVRPADAGQPQVDWIATYRVRATEALAEARGHVEIRWSHGRFVGAPEAKVYTDTSIAELPGYFALT
jgi:hypothetical protein